MKSAKAAASSAAVGEVDVPIYHKANVITAAFLP
jgi:hypothetical protein